LPEQLNHKEHEEHKGGKKKQKKRISNSEHRILNVEMGWPEGGGVTSIFDIRVSVFRIRCSFLFFCSFFHPAAFFFSWCSSCPLWFASSFGSVVSFPVLRSEP